MALLFEQGELLLSDCTIIAHQMNCFGVFQTPFAKQIQRIYPEAVLVDKKYKLPPRKRLGRFSFVLTNDGSKLIFQLYGQFRYGEKRNYTDYEALKNSLEQCFKAVQLAEKKGYPIKIGLPQDFGTGIAGGDQERIYSMLKSFSATYQYDIHLYEK